ncbi:MAG TPA: extracellular solute-binding protein [Treponemataceae bacterium]|nr:extracellular solute-binding protein [Treponemataceae bacterium]HQL03692.1 extracellular solute-binding protein [Treponemataceae bacterium]
MRNYKKVLLFCLLSLLPIFLINADETGVEKAVIRWTRGSSINEYLKEHEKKGYPSASITIDALSYSSSNNAVIKHVDELQGKNNVLSWEDEEGEVVWPFYAPESGLYFVELEYLPLVNKGMSIELELRLDGGVPHDDFVSVRFSRTWKDAGAVRRDSNGNDLYPEQEEVPQWTVRDFIDTQGFYNKRIPLYVEKGNHSLSLVLKREALALKTIRLYNPSPLPSYKNLAAVYNNNSYTAPSKKIIKVQAEQTFQKSDSTLIPTYDRTDAATEPSHPSKIRLNTLGGNWTWKLPGQWAEWKVAVPEDGLYTFFVKARQHNQRGMAAVAKISIDGHILCLEHEALEIPYKLDWQVLTPLTDEGEETPVYLTKGEHIVRIETSLGRLTPILTAVDDLTYEVNTLRRRFIMIMGSEPDKYRDYQLEKEIPGLIEKLEELSARFTEQADIFERITGQKGSEAATLRILAHQLSSFADKPQYISHKQNNFRDNIANLATWILQRKEIPLELDYIGFVSAGSSLPEPSAGFLAQHWFNIRSFFASFFEDYNSIGGKEKNAVNVWIQSGRDQAQILRDLITNDFTPKTGITINLSLVQGSLIEATLAGRGPEVAINIARSQPVDLASRGALYDLSEFERFDSIRSNFFPTAFDPYTYRSGIYAVPFTQDFHMMFYRKDIFRELGIEPPKTWKEMYAVIPVLQRNNMQIGLPYQQVDSMDLIQAGMGARNLFPTLLLQNGGSFYIENDTKTGLTQPEAYTAFKQWTDFYANYGFINKFDFYTRFRSGEMPLGIASYGMYNMFTAAAPEIRNEWAMIPIPGMEQSDGSINRSEGAGGGASIMFNKIKNPDAGWAFLEWWSSPEVQLKFATQLETLLGTAARLNTANIKTFEKMPWSKSEAETLLDQWKDVKEIPEVPGGYYTVRMVDTAFSKVFYNNMNARATLYKYCQLIDEEIARKRKELGLDE